MDHSICKVFNSPFSCFSFFVICKTSSFRMFGEFTVRVQWPSGSILSVLAKPDTTVEDLSKILKFACRSASDQILLTHNGVSLIPNVSLAIQKIKEQDILNAHIIQTNPKQSNSDRITPINTRIRSKVDAVIEEAARMEDQHYNRLELRPSISNHNHGVGYASNQISNSTELLNKDEDEDYDDSDYDIFIDDADLVFSQDDTNPSDAQPNSKSKMQIPSNPLPVFWDSSDFPSINNSPSTTTIPANQINDNFKKDVWSSWVW